MPTFNEFDLDIKEGINNSNNNGSKVTSVFLCKETEALCNTAKCTYTNCCPMHTQNC